MTAMRVVAVHVPHFAVVAHRRRDPVLRRRPVALVAGERDAVVACSPDAARRGIAPGMSAAAAEAACASAALVALDAAYCRDEHARVGTALLTVAPAVEDAEGAEDELFGSWCFRAEGLSRLHATCGVTHTCAESDVSATRTKLIVADVSLGVGVVAIGVATGLLIAHLRAAPSKAALRLDAFPVAGGGVAALGGRF